MKIKFNLDDELPLNETIELRSMIIIVSAVFKKITIIIHMFSSMNVYIHYEKYKNALL